MKIGRLPIRGSVKFLPRNRSSPLEAPARSGKTMRGEPIWPLAPGECADSWEASGHLHFVKVQVGDGCAEKGYRQANERDAGGYV